MTGFLPPPRPCETTDGTAMCACGGLKGIADALDRLTYAVLTGQSSLADPAKGRVETATSSASTPPVPPSRWSQWLESIRRPLVDEELTVQMVTDEEGWLREQTPEDEDDDPEGGHYGWR